MITSKQELKEYLEKDRKALKIPDKTRPKFWKDEIWRYEIYLRKREYYENTGKHPLLKAYYQMKQHNLGIKLGFSIPCNVFGAGLRINHYGYLVVSPKARIGEYCDIHQGVNIGESVDQKAPVVGNHVWIGPGAKLFGGIRVADRIQIGANAVVNKDFMESGITIAGVPAKKVSGKGTQKDG